MQNNDERPQGLDSQSSITPSADDSINSLTNDSVDSSAQLNDTPAVVDLGKDDYVSMYDQDDLNDELEPIEDELADVRVANLNDDLDEIETEFVDPKFTEVTSAAELSANESLYSILRNNASLVLDNRAARKRTNFLMGCIVILCILLSVLVYAFTLYPKTVYIATKDNAAICEVQPEDNPYLTDLAISEFARDGILSLYSINFTNWQSQTDRVFDEYFTSDGKIRTVQALKDSGLIAYVNNNALSLRANSTQTSHVESKGFFPNGTPYWTVSFPFVVEVYSGREKEPIQVRQYVATTRVVVDRASSLNPKGLGIDSVTLFEPKN